MTKEKETKRATLSGKGVEVYLEGAYTRMKKDGSLGVNVIPRKRRDVGPDAPFAGSYIRTAAYTDRDGNKRVTTNQLVSVETFNKMRAVNNLKPITENELREALPEEDENGTRTKPATSLISKDEPIVFKTNVFTDDNAKDRNGRWSHLINPKVIEPSDNRQIFSFDQEKRLQELKRAEREEMNKGAETSEKEEVKEKPKTKVKEEVGLIL